MMDRYTARINLHGTTERERAKNRLIANLKNKLPASLSYKDVKINGVETQLIINTGTQPYYKEFESLPGQIINIGDYVEWAESYWIVVTCDSDDEIYRDGKLTQCNHLLKWQNEHGEIIERWAVIQSASKYNDGTTGSNVITLGSDQLSVIVPLDDEAIKLKKSMSKKFFIDTNKDDPTAYELTGTGNVPDTYNGYGITSWIVKECAYTASEDDLKYGVCDYKESNSEQTTLKSVISGDNKLKVGFYRTYTLNTAEYNISNFSWNIVSDFKVNTVVNNDEIKLMVKDTAMIGQSFKLQVLVNGNEIYSQIEIDVVEGF